MIGEGFNDYFHSKKGSIISFCNTPSALYRILKLQNTHPAEIPRFYE